MTDMHVASTATGAPTKNVTLTERMRTSTKAVHDKSDRLVNLKLALVLTSHRLYGESISLFAEIYKCLETILERQKSHPQLRHFQEILPYLRRYEGFQADIEHFLTPTEQQELNGLRYKTSDVSNTNVRANGKIVASPPDLVDYLDRLDELEREDPTRLIAYIYHMYMAIFAGGYIIKKLVKKSRGLPKDSDDGVKAFCINDINDKRELIMDGKKIRTELKRIVDEVVAPSLNEKEMEGIMEESHDVFQRNNAVVASVKNTPAFHIASVRCRNLFLIPAVAVVVGILFATFKPLAIRRKS